MAAVYLTAGAGYRSETDDLEYIASSAGVRAETQGGPGAVTGDGSLVSDVATLAGSGSVSGPPADVTGGGDLACGSCLMTGSVVLDTHSSVTLAVYLLGGHGLRSEVTSAQYITYGIGFRSESQAVGASITGGGSLVALDASFAGVGAVNPAGTISGNGNLQAASAQIAGGVVRGIVNFGSPFTITADAATFSGSGEWHTPIAITGSGGVTADAATFAGIGFVTQPGEVLGVGALTSDVALLSGSGVVIDASANLPAGFEDGPASVGYRTDPVRVSRVGSTVMRKTPGRIG